MVSLRTLYSAVLLEYDASLGTISRGLNPPNETDVDEAPIFLNEIAKVIIYAAAVRTCD
jgi:hypothetical protein